MAMIRKGGAGAALFFKKNLDRARRYCYNRI